MKNIIILSVLLLSCVISSTAFAAQEIPAKITFRVQNDLGDAVSGAVMKGYFLDASRSGKGQAFTGATDENGIMVVEGMALKGIYAHFSKDKHYVSTVKESLRSKKGRRKVTSWSKDVSVVLKRVIAPIAMITKTLKNPYVAMQNSAGRYNLKNTAKFDLIEGDFLPPHGKGLTNDIEFVWKMSIEESTRKGRPLSYKTKCDVTMSGEKNGLIKGAPGGGIKGVKGSALISDYKAPADGYVNSLSLFRNVAGGKVETNDKNHYLFYFRIRSDVSGHGEMKNAVYGKIYGPINGNFQYYLNPAPNDRNIEDNPAKNVKMK